MSNFLIHESKNNIILCCEIVDKSSQRILFNHELMEIFDHERYLDNGRFKRFEEIQDFPYQCTPSTNGKHYSYTVFKRDNTIPTFENMVNWISENTNGKWGCDITHIDLIAYMTFKFEIKNEAVLFKMIF